MPKSMISASSLAEDLRHLEARLREEDGQLEAVATLLRSVSKWLAYLDLQKVAAPFLKLEEAYNSLRAECGQERLPLDGSRIWNELAGIFDGLSQMTGEAAQIVESVART